jgi:hypothetical protein
MLDVGPIKFRRLRTHLSNPSAEARRSTRYQASVSVSAISSSVVLARTSSDSGNSGSGSGGIFLMGGGRKLGRRD